MRPVILSVLLFLIVSLLTACEKKEVKLSPVDTFTGGKQKEWLVAENYFSGVNLTEAEDCYKDDTIIFSKGDEEEDKRYPIYTWKKNAIKCEGGVDQDVKLFFSLKEDLTTITFFSYIDGGDLDPSKSDNIWNIDKAENTEIRLSREERDKPDPDKPNEPGKLTGIARLRLVPYTAPRDSTTTGN